MEGAQTLESSASHSYSWGSLPQNPEAGLKDTGTTQLRRPNAGDTQELRSEEAKKLRASESEESGAGHPKELRADMPTEQAIKSAAKGLESVPEDSHCENAGVNIEGLRGPEPHNLKIGGI